MTYWTNGGVDLRLGDCRDVLRAMPAESVHCVVTSPPYWGLRDYGIGEASIGLEPTPDLYVEHIVEVFREVRRVLRADGTVWLNLGDGYSSGGRTTYNDVGSNLDVHVPKQRPDNPPGLKPKDLLMMPARVALALQADGWWLRSEIVWAKTNTMPESMKDRPTSSHEKLFLLAKAAHYWYDADAIKTPAKESSISRWQQNIEEQQGSAFNDRWDQMTKDEQQSMGANKRDVWWLSPATSDIDHYAVMPEGLVEPCVLAGCPEDGTVLDPFGGSGTVGVVAQKLGRRAILIDMKGEYLDMARHRIEAVPLPMRLE